MLSCSADRSISGKFMIDKDESGATLFTRQEKYLKGEDEFKELSQSEIEASACINTFWSRKITRLDGEIVRIRVEPGLTTTVTFEDGSVCSDVAPSQFLT